MNFLADVQHARALTVQILRLAAEQKMSVGRACECAREYLELRGYSAPDDPLAFATGGKSTMRDGDLRAQFVIKSSGETI